MAKSVSKEIKRREERFARVSWRLALRLGYGEHIELVRSAMNRFMDSHILNHLLNFDHDPTAGEVGAILRPGVEVVAAGSFFGTCFLGAKQPACLGGNACSTYWGISHKLYMLPANERILRICGTASVIDHNLNVIERALKLTVGQTERHRPTIEEVLERGKKREEALQQLVGKSSVFNRVGLVRRHVLGQPVGFVSRAPIS